VTHQVQAPAHQRRRRRSLGDEGRGWLLFSAMMFFASSAVNAIYGVTALVKDSHFQADELLFGNLSLWGAIYLCFAAAALLAAFLILFNKALGSVLGVGLALLHGTLALLSIGAYPVWSVLMLVIDGLIIYGLTVHGFELAE